MGDIRHNREPLVVATIAAAENAVIKQLAPKHLRGSYFGAQNLVYLELALDPVLYGIVLVYMTPVTIFFLSIALISLIFYCLAFHTIIQPSLNATKPKIQVSENNSLSLSSISEHIGRMQRVSLHRFIKRESVAIISLRQHLNLTCIMNKLNPGKIRT